MSGKEWAPPEEGGALRFIEEPLHEWEFEFANLSVDWKPSHGIHEDQRSRITVYAATVDAAFVKAEQLAGPPGEGRRYVVRLARAREARPGRLTTT